MRWQRRYDLLVNSADRAERAGATEAVTTQSDSSHSAGDLPVGIPTGRGPSGRASAPAVQRVRLTFEKGAALRFIGHLDLARMWERAARRAALPLAYSLGFTPHPRLTFAAPLTLGATAEAEIVDVYLRETVPPQLLRARLAAQLPRGCSIGNATELDITGPAVSSEIRWAEYRAVLRRAALPTERWEPVAESVPWRPPTERLPPHEPEDPPPDTDEIQRRIDALLAADTLTRERMREGMSIHYDLRRLLFDLWLDSETSATDVAVCQLGMVLRLDSTGAGRPEEIVLALGMRARAIRRLRIGLHTDSLPTR